MGEQNGEGEEKKRKEPTLDHVTKLRVLLFGPIFPRTSVVNPVLPCSCHVLCVLVPFILSAVSVANHNFIAAPAALLFSFLSICLGVLMRASPFLELGRKEMKLCAKSTHAARHRFCYISALGLWFCDNACDKFTQSQLMVVPPHSQATVL